MSNTQYPYDSNPGQTHFDGCWRERKHHNCAVDEIKRLRARQLTAEEAQMALQYMRKGIVATAAESGRIVALRAHLRAITEDSNPTPRTDSGGSGTETDS